MIEENAGLLGRPVTFNGSVYADIITTLKHFRVSDELRTACRVAFRSKTATKIEDPITREVVTVARSHAFSVWFGTIAVCDFKRESGVNTVSRRVE